MARRTRSLREMRAEVEAAEARGLISTSKPARPRSTQGESEGRERPGNQPRLRMVWAVCDAGGRTIVTFDYPKKDDAEAHAQALTAKGKGRYFVRSIKEPIPG